ncbi:MAG: hypothetical protein QW291_04440 [Thermofilaceae archaeon]
MRCYFLGSSWSFSAIAEALWSLNSKYSNALSEGSEDSKVIRVEYVKKTGERLEALIRVIYKSRLGKRWSDSYVLTFTQLDSGTMVTAKRISGIGRVDPDFIVECLITGLITKRT